jgi:aryl-alcohol dehydrogenase
MSGEGPGGAASVRLAPQRIGAQIRRKPARTTASHPDPVDPVDPVTERNRKPAIPAFAAPAPSRAKSHPVRAAVLRRRGAPLQLEVLALEAPRADEVRVRLVACGICRTDVDLCDEWRAADGAVVLGHEGAGVVEQVGAQVRAVRRGDHVVLSYQSCGRCGPCRAGRPAACRRFEIANFGFQRLDGSNALGGGVRGHFFGQSSFATHALATERNIVRVSKRLPLALLAPLGCGLQTGAGTILNSLGVPRGASVAIFGTGAVGLAAVMAARIAGAAPIIGIDIVPKRLRLARELGAAHTIDSRRADVAARVRAIAGAVDYALEITGDPALGRLALALLTPRGTLALIATPDAAPARSHGRKVLGIAEGDAVPQQFIPRLIRLWQAGRFPFDRLVRFYPFERINQALTDLRRGTTIKPVLRISDP